MPVPFQAPFTYRLPAGVPVPERGVRVLVPFGGRRMIGVVCGPGAEEAGRSLKDVVQVLDEEPLALPPLLDLALFVASHYLAPPGECFKLVMPPAGVRASRAVVRLRPGATAADAGDDPLLKALGKGPLRLSLLAKRLGADPQSRLARLKHDGARRGRAAAAGRGVPRGAGGGAQRPRGRRSGPCPGPRARAARGGRWEGASRISCASALRCAAPSTACARRARSGSRRSATAARLRSCPRERRRRSPPPRIRRRPWSRSCVPCDSGGFQPFLLHGVTGSGKTEVYLRAVEAALARGRGAILLVPEIGLTPMLVRAARARFGATVSVLHSELSAGERHDEWWRIREGEARVAVGARSAVFAPMPEPGPDRGRRGARRRLQAGREPALPRPRRGGRARAARGLPGGARLGDAVARVAGQRQQRQVRAARAADPHRTCSACRASRSSTGARC